MSAETRDRLNELATEHGLKNVDQAIGFLLDEQFRSRCVSQADLFQESRPEDARRDRNTFYAMDELWSPQPQERAA